MTHATHTPGPWTYESDHTHRQFNIRMLGHHIGTKDEAKHICTVNNLPSHVLANRDPLTAEANARLIASAPELLAALELIDSHLTRCINFSGVNPELRERLEQQQHNARAALNKAQGL